MSQRLAIRCFTAGATRALLACAGLAVAAAHAGAIQQGGEIRVNRDAQLIVEFDRRAQAYVAIHKKADAALPEVPSSGPPDQVDAHQRAVAALIEKSRANAKQGDLFTREIRAYFRRQIGRVVAGADGQQIRDTIMEENPGAIRLRINGRYPDTLPMTTMPPQILASLPKLPKELEYRFIGSRLVLLDTHTQLIVDYIDDSIPR